MTLLGNFNKTFMIEKARLFAGNTKGGSIIALLTSCLTGLD